jgi:hypothetical protein
MVSSGLLRRVALVRATRRNIPEDTILHSHRRENLKSYIIFHMYPTRTNKRRSNLYLWAAMGLVDVCGSMYSEMSHLSNHVYGHWRQQWTTWHLEQTVSGESQFCHVYSHVFLHVPFINIMPLLYTNPALPSVWNCPCVQIVYSLHYINCVYDINFPPRVKVT